MPCHIVEQLIYFSCLPNQSTACFFHCSGRLKNEKQGHFVGSYFQKKAWIDLYDFSTEQNINKEASFNFNRFMELIYLKCEQSKSGLFGVTLCILVCCCRKRMTFSKH